MLLKINYKNACSHSSETWYAYVVRPTCFISQRRAAVSLGANSIDTVQTAVSYARVSNARFGCLGHEKSDCLY
jgi:hypothetical protein